MRARCARDSGSHSGKPLYGSDCVCNVDSLHYSAWRAVGVVEAGGRQLVALEDVARHYRRPSICDIKVGFRTWYPSGDAAYIQRCQLKDAATTQSTLGFKVCGMQVRLASTVCILCLCLCLCLCQCPCLCLCLTSIGT